MPLWGRLRKWKLGLSSDQATPESLGQSRAMGHLSLRKCSEEYRSGMEMSHYIQVSQLVLECVSSLCSELKLRLLQFSRDGAPMGPPPLITRKVTH